MSPAASQTSVLQPRALEAEMSQTQVPECRSKRGKRPSCSYLAVQPLVPAAVMQNLDCCFCMRTVMRPVQHKCGSIFCDACVEQWQVAQKNAHRFSQCPMCRDYLDDNMVPVALPVRHILMNMRARCDNCSFEGSIDCVLHHMQHHTEFVCVNRCGAVNLTLATMRQHYDLCSQQMHASCDYDCGMHGQRLEVQHHMQHCENRNNGERIVPLLIEMHTPLQNICPLQMVVDVQFSDGSYDKAQVMGYTDLGLILKSESQSQSFEASVFERNLDIGAHVMLDLRVQVKHVHCPTALAGQHSSVDLKPLARQPVRAAVDSIGKINLPDPQDASHSRVSQDDVLLAGRTHDRATRAQQQQQRAYTHMILEQPL